MNSLFDSAPKGRTLLQQEKQYQGYLNLGNICSQCDKVYCTLYELAHKYHIELLALLRIHIIFKTDQKVLFSIPL